MNYKLHKEIKMKLLFLTIILFISINSYAYDKEYYKYNSTSREHKERVRDYTQQSIQDEIRRGNDNRNYQGYNKDPSEIILDTPYRIKPFGFDY